MLSSTSNVKNLTKNTFIVNNTKGRVVVKLLHTIPHTHMGRKEIQYSRHALSFSESVRLKKSPLLSSMDPKVQWFLLCRGNLQRFMLTYLSHLWASAQEMEELGVCCCASVHRCRDFTKQKGCRTLSGDRPSYERGKLSEVLLYLHA